MWFLEGLLEIWNALHRSAEDNNTPRAGGCLVLCQFSAHDHIVSALYTWAISNTLRFDPKWDHRNLMWVDLLVHHKYLLSLKVNKVAKVMCIRVCGQISELSHLAAGWYVHERQRQMNRVRGRSEAIQSLQGQKGKPGVKDHSLIPLTRILSP